MTKTKKWCLAVGILLIGMIVLFLAGLFPRPAEAHAEVNYFSAEQYTENDQLLQEDGSRSEYRDISNFAQDVKAGYVNQSFPELAQVVPLEYLETTEENAVFAYNGKEYGFYLAKDGDYFDLLLIDFIYTFKDINHTNLEYKIRIEPILSQSFWRSGTAGNYKWQKVDNYYTYYVANPRFLSVVRNENALNYGDDGYSKVTDDGVITIQTRTNYSKISYKTEEDLYETCDEFLGDKILSTVTDAAVDFLDTYTGGLASFFKDLFELSDKLYEEGQETPIKADNEANIFTQQSKSEQRNGPKDGYSRVAGFAPIDEIVLAAAADTSSDANANSYAEFITVLSETNYRTRLNQYCEFDIYRRTGLYDSMEKVNNPSGEEFYSFSNEKILFSEGSEKSLAFDTAQATYNLPHGTDTFIFNPALSGTYTFVADDASARLSLYADENKADVKFSGSSSGSAYLRAGISYRLDVATSKEDGAQYQIIASVGEWSAGSTKTSQPIPANGQLYKLSVAERGGYQIVSDNGNIRFRLYDQNLQLIESSQNNSLQQYMAPDINYYLYVSSATNQAQTTTLTFAEVPSIEEDVSYGAESGSMSAMYRFTAPSSESGESDYAIILKDFGDDLLVDLYGYDGVANVRSSTNRYILSVSLKSNETIYIKITSEYDYTLKVVKAQNAITWVIDGEDVEGDTVFIPRGTQQSIALKVDGEVFAAEFVYPEGDYYISNGKLILPATRRLTNPTDEETYLNIFAFYDGSPYMLSICVIHDFEPNFEVYYEDYGYNSGDYGLAWDKFVNDSESYEIFYTLSGYGKNISRSTGLLNGSSEVNGNSFSVYDIVEGWKESAFNNGEKNMMQYRHVHIRVDKIKFVYSDKAEIFIYNTESSEFDKVEDLREQYQNLTHGSDTVKMYIRNGNGQADDPYIISTATDLYNVRYMYALVYQPYGSQSLINYYFKLVNNIVIPSNVDWDPIEVRFTGTLDGGNHYITYKTLISQEDLNDGDNFGLFSSIAGAIENLELRNCSITTQGNAMLSLSSEYTVTPVGILAGSTYEGFGLENIKITNPNIECNIKKASVGGMVGSHHQTWVQNCTVEGGSLTTYDGSIGGLAGLGDIDRFHGGKCTTTIRKKLWVEGDQVGKVVGNSQSTADVDVSGMTIVTEPVEVEGEDPCMAAGTLITLANGSQVPVEQLTGNEMLLVWNMDTGTLDIAPIVFIDSDPIAMYSVINLYFSDGTQVKVISEHGFWDYNLNQYVYIDEDAAQYIGHWFNKLSTDENGNSISQKVQLVNVVIQDEYTTAWSPVTYGHLCYYVNGMLSMPGGIEGLFNIFEVDAETMKYDEAQMQADIAQYGLFTYEEFAELFPVSEEVFEAFNGQYLKVAMGKGLIDAEGLQTLIERYAEFLSVI